MAREPIEVYKKETESVEIRADLRVWADGRIACNLAPLLDELIVESLGLVPGELQGRFKIEVTRLD